MSVAEEFKSAAKAVKYVGGKIKKASAATEHVPRRMQDELEAVAVLVHSAEANPDRASQPDLLHFISSLRKLAYQGQDEVETFYVSVAPKVHLRKNPILRYASACVHYNRITGSTGKMEQILQRLQDSRERFNNYRIPDGIASSSSQQRVAPSPTQENYLLYDNQVPVGIDDVIVRLAQSLTNPESDFKVLGILGVVGVGKTFLARNLYRHPQVTRWFTYRAFVSVSPRWDEANLLREIYVQIVKPGKDVTAHDQRHIRQELEGFLRHHRCLIVLDNIWHKGAWDVVGSLLDQSTGSRLILTSENRQVVLYADNKCILHEPQLLNDAQKWELFSMIAMEGRPGIENDATFKALAEEMLKNRQGLPLEVKALAGLAKTKTDLFEWENLCEASDEYILQDVWKLLELSNSHLPTHLQKLVLCFAAGGGHFDAQMTIRFWAAENLIQAGPNIRLEDKAMIALNELAQYCLIEVTRRSVRGHIEQFLIHDVMLQSFVREAKQVQFLEKICSAAPNAQPRRIYISSRGYCAEDNPGLQALVLHNDESNGDGVHDPNGAREFLKCIVEKCMLLKVLIICGGGFLELPKKIKKLLLLKYLHIDATSVIHLPKSAKKLIHLLYLDLHSPEGLGTENLSGIFSKMGDLRGVVLPRLIGGSIKTLGLSGCKSLQSLQSGAGKWMVKDLPALSLTLQNLDINGITEMAEMEAIYQCPGITQGGICKLRCDYNVSGLEFDLQKLMQCTTLWSLELSGRLTNPGSGRAIQFPLSLEELCLSGSGIQECSDLMGVLGRLPSLKYLSLSHGSYLGTQLSCTGGAFPQLRLLRLECLADLEGWEMVHGAMPRVEKIEIGRCANLKALPQAIRLMPTLGELNITCMPEVFCQRLRAGGEDFHITQHIPIVNVNSPLPCC